MNTETQPDFEDTLPDGQAIIEGEFVELTDEGHQFSPDPLEPEEAGQLPILFPETRLDASEPSQGLQTLYYFLVGGGLATQEVAIAYLKELGFIPRSAQSPFFEKLQLASIGLAGAGIEFSQQAVNITAEYADGWFRWGRERAGRPLERSPIFAPLRFALQVGDATLTRLAERGAQEREKSLQRVNLAADRIVDDLVRLIGQRPELTGLVVTQARKALPALAQDEMVAKLVDAQVDLVLPKLAESDPLQNLIDTQARMLLPKVAASDELDIVVNTQATRLVDLLAQNEEVQSLVRSQADEYLSYLQEENQTQVQELVQGQSLGLANEVMDEIREKTVTADTLVERVVRRILRRKPREALEGPSETLRQRARHQRLQ